MRKPLLSMATMLAATILVSSVSPAAEPSRQADEAEETQRPVHRQQLHRMP